MEEFKIILTTDKTVTDKEENINEKWLAKSLDECIKTMQQIKFICERAKKFDIEEKDIDDILELLRGKV